MKIAMMRSGGWWVLAVIFWPVDVGLFAQASKQDMSQTVGTISEEEPVVELPPMIILEDRAGARWRYVAIPGAEILSVCSEETTVRFADIYRAQRELMRLVVPEEFLPSFVVPEIVVLFDQRKGEAMPEELREKANALEPAQSRPVELSMEALGKAALRVRLMPNLMVNSLDSITSCADVSRIEVSYNWTTWEEGFRLGNGYVRALLERHAPALPEWYVEGVAELLSGAQAKNDSLLLWPTDWAFKDEKGRPIIGVRKGTDDPRAHVMKPLREMFDRRKPRSAEDMATVRANRALFVRWALDGKAPGRRAELAELVRRSMTEPVTGELLKACFRQSEEQLWRQVEAYLPLAVRRPTTLRSTHPGSDARLKVRDATSLEVARIMGDWQRLEAVYLSARPEFQERYRTAARKAVAKAYDNQERDPQLLMVSGLIEADAGNDARARELLEGAMATAEPAAFRPAAGFALASLRLKAAVEKPEGARGLLSTEQTTHSLEPLMRVRLAGPPMVEGYSLMAEAWVRTEAVSEEAISIINEGLKLFATEAAFLLRAAELHGRHGSSQVAVRLAAKGLLLVSDRAMRTQFEAILKAYKASESGHHHDQAQPLIP